jgi:hypothetical protein
MITRFHALHTTLATPHAPRGHAHATLSSIDTIRD